MLNSTYSNSNEITDGFVLRFAMTRCMSKLTDN